MANQTSLWTRRQLLRAAGVAGAAACTARPAHAAAEVSEEVKAFHAGAPVVDLHIDTLLWMRFVGYDIAARHRRWLPFSAFLQHMDLPRAAEGGLDGAVMGIVANPDEVREELILPLKLLARVEDDRGISQTLAALSLLQETARQHADRMERVLTGSDFRRSIEAGRFATLAGLEGAHGIGGSLDNVSRAHAAGLRMLGFVHFQATEAAYPMTVSRFDGEGLTAFGIDLLRELERLRIVADIAHLNAAGVEQFLSLATRPFVVSHTACRGLVDHPRNLRDDQIRAIAEKGGIVGIAASRDFLGGGDVEQFVDHLEHVVRVGGEDAAALGTDFDGAIVPVPGLEDVTAFPRVSAALLERGHPPERVRKILGENALRVLTDVCG